jgi:protein-S-isoprenylcysteine O-methyltransferase Ste14
MYLGVTSMLLAVATFVGTFPFYLATTAYFLVLNNVFCPYEETRLAEAFGDTYITYKIKVRRWF